MICIRRATILLAGLTVAIPTTAAPVVQLVTKQQTVSSQAALTMVTACLDLATTRGWKMQVAVVDRHGGLVAFGRSDGAESGAQDISLLKARTSGRMPWSTADFAKYARDATTGQPGPMAFLPGYTGIDGGLPIITLEGEHIGGIGVSGALPGQDRECAQSGLDAVLPKSGQR